MLCAVFEDRCLCVKEASLLFHEDEQTLAMFQRNLLGILLPSALRASDGHSTVTGAGSATREPRRSLI